jgi:N-acetyl-anhydromuramyl-L-alanine amidase AmpD
MSLDLSKIRQVPLNETEYLKESCDKKQIVLHHTAGNSSGVNVVNDWNKDKRGRIATCVTISGKGQKNTFDGEIIQAFSSKHWAYHLGVKTDVFKARKLPWINLDKISIGIEICNWGALDFENGKYLTYVDSVVKSEDVVELSEPFKGKKFYHKYTNAQIDSVRNLLLYWKDIYNIDLSYDYDRLFTVNDAALTGKEGLYTHNSYRKDKIDVVPQPELIAMLKSL